MSFKKGFFRNLLVSGGFQYATQALVFLSTVVTSRLLEPETFGLVGLITVFSGFVSVFADSGISYAVIRSDYGRTFHRAMDNLAIVIGFLLCLLTCLLAYPISVFFANSELLLPTLVLSTVFILKGMTLVRSALLAKALQFGTIGRLTLFSSAVQVLFTIALAAAGWSYWALIVPQLASAALLVILLHRKVPLEFHMCRPAQLKTAFRHTQRTLLNLMGFNLVNYWARNLDNLLVGKLFGVAELGIYNRAYNLLAMPLGIVSGLVSNTLYPSLKKLHMQGGNVHREYLFILKTIAVVSFPVSCVLVLFPKELVLLLWGQSWFAVSALLPYFGLLVLCQSLLSTTGQVLVLLEKERVMRISGWVSACAMVSGILAGALTSLVAVAQFYSLAFVAFVLPFNLFYLFIHALGFNKREIFRFWTPIILGSLCVWLGCYFMVGGLKAAGIVTLFVTVLWHVRTEYWPFVSGKIKRVSLMTRVNKRWRSVDVIPKG